MTPVATKYGSCCHAWLGNPFNRLSESVDPTPAKMFHAIEPQLMSSFGQHILLQISARHAVGDQEIVVWIQKACEYAPVG